MPVTVAAIRRRRDRAELLRLLPKNSVGAELGVFKGEFSREILRIVRPRELHLVDVWWLVYGDHYPDWGDYTDFGRLTTRRAYELTRHNVRNAVGTRVLLHVMDDIEFFESLPDGTLDWVYIDSSHEFEQSRRELALAARKVRPDGLICGDDWDCDPRSDHFGVTRAVLEFLESEPYELIHLHGMQWALRRYEAGRSLTKVPGRSPSLRELAE